MWCLGQGKLLDCVFHCQESITWLLDTYVPLVCPQVIVSNDQEFFVQQTERLSRSRKFGKCCDSRGTFTRNNLNFASFRNDERSCRLADKGGRFEGFIKEVSLPLSNQKKFTSNWCRNLAHQLHASILHSGQVWVQNTKILNEKKRKISFTSAASMIDHLVNPSFWVTWHIHYVLYTMHYALCTPKQLALNLEFRQCAMCS